ncbi:hypothetical protein BOO86_21880 [Mycobacterium sp. CBMA 234]|uniref:VOC family protein n=1 Tax=Mycolicibacterium sp. CBMA 234 TaxID=1918495 RepID=UPI0012DC92F2|nr:hypothetical protein [Mycolicibacterium sp. CBMA 234]MUL67139.1 hypothetical protein [Mycolicibacterium sp. CBMA 234]
MSVDEITLLTYRFDAVLDWWAALLDTSPEVLGPRSAALNAPGLRVSVNRSDIALDAHPEVAGVTAVTLNIMRTAAARAVLRRLTSVGASCHRATTDEHGVRLWFLDPDGTNVALRLPADFVVSGAHDGEVDPDEPLRMLTEANGDERGIHSLTTD